MRHRSFRFLIAAFVAAATSGPGLGNMTPVSANDFNDACTAFGSAEVIFVGRVKSAPITRRISGEEEIEKARLIMEAAERELKAFEGLKMPLEIGEQRNRELAIRFVKAQAEWGRTRAMYPPPFDLSLIPMSVETPFRGVPPGDLFLMNKGQPELDPSRSYLIYAQRDIADFLAPNVFAARSVVDIDSAATHLEFLNDAANASGATVYGSLGMEDPDDQRRLTPLGGVVLRLSLDGQTYETSTRADGTFLVTGVPQGMLRIEPALPEHLTLPPQANGGIVRGGCLEVHMRARLNGRIRGRVLLENGEPFRGLVDVIGDEPQNRHFTTSPAFTNDRGEFSFNALPPGRYLIGVNIARQPTASTPFRPTYFPGSTDRSQATPVIVAAGTEQTDLEWVVNSRLREGSIEVSFNTNGQPQKAMGVCVTMFDADNRDNGGVGQEGRSAEPVIVKVVEGVRYRLAAWARTSSGFAQSEIVDLFGAPGHRAITLQMTSLSETPTPNRCAYSDKPFSPSR